MSAPVTQTWFLAREAAEYCRISPRTLARWRKANRIRHYNGRYHRDDLDQAVRNTEPVLEERDVVRGTEPGMLAQARRELTHRPDWLGRLTFAPGELEKVWDEVEFPNRRGMVVFGVLDHCPIPGCPTYGQSHEHSGPDVRAVLPPDPRTIGAGGFPVQDVVAGLKELAQAPSSLPLGSGHVLVPPEPDITDWLERRLSDRQAEDAMDETNNG